MALATTAIFAAIAPVLALDTARRDIFIELAAQQLYASAWGAVYQQAVCYLAAHMMSLAPEEDSDGRSTASGPVTARSAGDVSISYGSSSSSGLTAADSALASTAYGRQFLALRATRSASAPRVILPSAT